MIMPTMKIVMILTVNNKDNNYDNAVDTPNVMHTEKPSTKMLIIMVRR